VYQKAKGDWEQITIDGKDFLSFYYSVSCGEIYGGWNPGYYLPEKKNHAKNMAKYKKIFVFSKSKWDNSFKWRFFPSYYC